MIPVFDKGNSYWYITECENNAYRQNRKSVALLTVLSPSFSRRATDMQNYP